MSQGPLCWVPPSPHGPKSGSDSFGPICSVIASESGTCFSALGWYGMSDSNLPLERLGWDAGWEETFAPYQAQGWFPARVVAQDKYRYLGVSSSGELEGRLLGRFLRRGHSEAELPKVGDWVACRLTRHTGEPVVIQAVLPRRTRLARKVPGRQAEEQVLVANVDLVFLVQALDSTFSCRLLERMLLMTLEGESSP